MKITTKRLVFTSAQHGQTIHAKGYKTTPLRTGYESLLAQRTGSKFANSAEDNGEVTKITKNVIVVKYDNGETKHFQLGRIHGSASGNFYPFDMLTNLKVGDKFEKGDTLVYNKSFFEPDRYTPGQTNWKAGVIGRLAFIDNIDTLEDGSVISPRLAKELETEVTEVRTLTFSFEQVISDLVKVGDKVDLDTPLCIIQDPEVAAMAEDDQVSESFKRLSSNIPRAKFVGTISKIECFYHGDYEDMSESVLELVSEFDNQLAKQYRDLGKKPVNGRDTGSLNVAGSKLDPFHVALRVYIDRDLTCETGDKLVFFNQMKTVISNIMTGENYCEDGTPLDIQFAKNSVDARQVVSPLLISTTTMLLRELTKHVVKLYKGEVDAKARS